MDEERSTGLQFLSGWKEIATYLRKGIRTVQRYEREQRLPIHRPAGGSAVLAVKAELDTWVTGGPARAIPRRAILNQRTNRLRAEFLLIDSEIALTFTDIAQGASDREKRRRATQIARDARDTIMRLREKVEFDEAGERTLEANLQRLKGNLQRLAKTARPE